MSLSRCISSTPILLALTPVKVSRIVHFLRLHLVGKKISKVRAPDDAVIFGKAGTTGPAFEAALKGNTVCSS